MAGVDYHNFTLNETTTAVNWEPPRSGPIYISVNAPSGSPTITLKTASNNTATDGPTIRLPDDSADITLTNNQGIHLLHAPKYLVVSGTSATSPLSFTANVHISF